MAKYRKKPLVIEAFQWQPSMGEVGGVVLEPNQPGSAPFYEVRTLEGPLRVSPGDFIITGVEGDRYPCKPDVFEATYELEEAPELGCPKSGSGGHHSDSYGDDGTGRCIWCGATPDQPNSPVRGKEEKAR